MIQIEGKYTNAIIFADTIEQGVIKQTLDICNHPIFEDAQVRIMPDCHEGKGCTIGFTSTAPKNGEVIPNIIGVDVHCGMLAIRIRNEEIDFKELDDAIMNHVPFGINGRKERASDVYLTDDLIEEIIRYNKDFLKRDPEDDIKKVGSLGGGNHFISIEKGSTGSWLIIHSGSRNFGNAMAKYFQEKAIETNLYAQGELKQLSYLTGKDAEDYMEFMKVAGLYASRSRAVMMQEIMRNTKLDLDITSVFETVHNCIGDDGIIRKGAISCKENEKVLIPINMAYGSFIAVGKGNEDWNNSGPHGAGRVLSRSKAKEQLSMEDYKESMKNVYSSRILQSTLDEAPMAYKDGDEIKNLIEPTAEIIDHLIPVYNFKG